MHLSIGTDRVPRRNCHILYLSEFVLPILPFPLFASQLGVDGEGGKKFTLLHGARYAPRPCDAAALPSLEDSIPNGN